jgi:exosortase/archaeosortase family protein
LHTYYRRPIVLLPIYLLSAIFSASLMNVVRIVVIAVAQEWYGFDLAHGWLHDLLGYCCLFSAILLLASFDKLFHIFFYPIRDNALPIRVGTGKNPLQMVWNFFLAPKKQSRHDSSTSESKPFLPPAFYYAIFFTLVGYQLTFASPELVRSVANSFSSKSSGSTDDEGWKLGGDKRIWNTPQNLFDNIDSLEVTNYENQVDGLDVSKGQFADIWNVKPKSGEIIYRLAISQPYNRFHDLTTCYTGVGWNVIQDRIVMPPSTAKSDAWPIKYSSWETPDGMYGYLTYSGITANGEPIILEESTLAKTFSRRFGFNRKVNLMDSECLMFQIWVTSTLPLSQDQVDSIIKLHFDLEVHVLNQLRQGITK